MGASGKFDPRRGSLKTWLSVVALACAPLDRSRKFCAAAPYRSRRSRLADPLGVPEALLAGERRAALNAAVDALAEPDREILLRRYYFGQKPREIAAALGLDKKQVDNRLYQIKRRLRASVTGAEESNMRSFSEKNYRNIQSLFTEKNRRAAPKTPRRAAAPFVLAAAVLAALLTVTALAADLFSPLAGDDLALGAVYEGDGVVSVHVENRSDKELKFQGQLRLLRWDTSEEIARRSAARPCVLRTRRSRRIPRRDDA